MFVRHSPAPATQRPEAARPPAAIGMSGRDNQLWLQLWRERRTDFHQRTVNRLLSGFWPTLGLPRGSRIFVPLCGKAWTCSGWPSRATRSSASS